MTMQEFMDAEGDFSRVNASYEIYDLLHEMRDECTDFDPDAARQLVEDAAQSWRVANPNVLQLGGTVGTTLKGPRLAGGVDMKLKISADLDEHEAELLASLFRGSIIEHRQEARFNHIAGKVTQAELDWHLGHADFVEATAKKLFPDWREEETRCVVNK